jgi:lipopolysaccharide/colanic/teichoic acid biosynthesis glycosyltransferase
MVKRLFDLVVAFVGLIALAPIWLVVGLLIKLESPGSVLYKGDRIGKDGVPFKIFKFRTMVINADRMGPALTHGKDARITRVGRVLRKWKIDEFPQLFNVLRGEMSLVGPRPESPNYVQHYTPEQRRVLQVKPGITGLTQVRFRHEETLLSHCTNLEEEYIQKIMPQKLALDLEYVGSQSLFLDLQLIVQTFVSVFAKDEFTEDRSDRSLSTNLR